MLKILDAKTISDYLTIVFCDRVRFVFLKIESDDSQLSQGAPNRYIAFPRRALMVLLGSLLVALAP